MDTCQFTYIESGHLDDQTIRYHYENWSKTLSLMLKLTCRRLKEQCLIERRLTERRWTERFEILAKKFLSLSEDADRYDELVDRYHNNVHFMNFQAQLIRDSILYRLPTSVHSQSTMVGAFAARSSQIDYGERKQIEHFCRNYQSMFALDYYIKLDFFYRVLNRVLRQERYDIIYQYRHAMIDVIKCLEKLFPLRTKAALGPVYRGQQMTIFELEKMKNNVGELVSCSSFLSTSLDLQLAQIFAGDGSGDDPYLVSVIVQISLDTEQTMGPYAHIEDSSEKEVLFPPGTKFRLMSCRKLHDDGRLWHLEMLAIPKNQQEQLILNHGETFLLLSSASGWPVRSWLFVF